MRKTLLTATLLAGLPLTGALAAPVLIVTGTDNGSALTFTPSTDIPGSLIGTFADSSFSQISVSVTGFPSVNEPDLGTVTLQISTATGFTGTHTIDLIATQSGLTFAAGGNGTLTQTFNNLIFSGTTPGGPATENFDINGTQVITHTFPASPPGTSTNTANDNNLPAITSDAQEFVAVFTGPSQDLEMTQEFTAAVPEPASLALLGVGLLGLGVVASRKRS